VLHELLRVLQHICPRNGSIMCDPVAKRGRRGGDAVEYVPAANAAHEAGRRLHRRDLSRKASECA